MQKASNLVGILPVFTHKIFLISINKMIEKLLNHVAQGLRRVTTGSSSHELYTSSADVS